MQTDNEETRLQQQQCSNESHNDVHRTPVHHRRDSSLSQTSSSISPRFYIDHNVTPLSRFVEDLSPDTKKLVYDMLKPDEDTETPLTKRRKIENVTMSPVDMSCLRKPDFFEMLDRNYVDMPKAPKSPKLAQYIEGVLGDASVRSSLSPLRTGDTVAETTPVGTRAESTPVKALRQFIQESRLQYCESMRRYSEMDNSRCDEVPSTQASQPIDVGWCDPDEFNRMSLTADRTNNAIREDYEL